MDPAFQARAMQAAIDQAKAAAHRGEVPVGAVVVGPDGLILAAVGNEVECRRDAGAHAEMLALRAASRKTGSKWLTGCDLVVTLEPCPMCAQAASLFRVRRLVFGAYDSKGGGVEHGARVLHAASCHHVPYIIGGVREAECGEILRRFFAAKR